MVGILKLTVQYFILYGIMVLMSTTEVDFFSNNKKEAASHIKIIQLTACSNLWIVPYSLSFDDHFPVFAPSNKPSNAVGN
jgi:hypothetical protein